MAAPLRHQAAQSPRAGKTTLKAPLAGALRHYAPLKMAQWRSLRL
jgi:hypothetical protein